jgi:ABC-type Fe3+ transport system substrate-binding protein
MALSLQEVYERAKGEGGTLVYYGTLAQINAEKILPAFEARFPGIKVEHVDATSDRLVSRVIAEARGGKVLADVLETGLESVQQVDRHRLLLQELPAEAAPYPDGLKGQYWIATDLIFIVPAWNTNLVRPDEVPRQFDDLADSRWRNRLIAEPRDWEVAAALTQKHGSAEAATEVLTRIAANNVEFHKGHSELAELLMAGQAAACLTCYAHHYPSRIRRGAPADFLRTEGTAQLIVTVVLNDAPHPYTAMLWQRWSHTEEGQQVFTDGGRTPAHPNVESRDKIRPEKIYPIGLDEIANMSRYDSMWKQVFQLR